MNIRINRINKVLPLAIICVLLQGCGIHKDKVDPYEGYNRAMFKFNKALDKTVIKPVTVTYNTIIPYPVRQGVSNAFDNLFLTSILANDLLQGEIVDFSNDLWRLIINTTVGIGGLFDVAKHVGFPKKYKDFGMTLYKWGDKNSPFFVIPIFGPSTIRDAAGFLYDYSLFSPLPRLRPISLRNSLYGLQLIDFRKRLLETDDLAAAASIDEYIFVRNAYLQYRNSLNNKEQSFQEELEEDPYVE